MKDITSKDFVIIYLSLSLLFVQWAWLKVERQKAFLEGRQSVYNEFSGGYTDYNESGEGYCFADKPPHFGACLNH